MKEYEKWDVGSLIHVKMGVDEAFAFIFRNDSGLNVLWSDLGINSRAPYTVEEIDRWFTRDEFDPATVIVR